MKPEWLLCPKCQEIIILKEKNMHQEGIPGKWIPKDFAEEMDSRKSMIKKMTELLGHFYDVHTGLSDSLPIGLLEKTYDVLDDPVVVRIVRD